MNPIRSSSSFKRTALLALGICAIALPIVPPAHAAPADNPLAAERWQTRPIVVVVPASDRTLLRRVESALQRTATREAFVEREMVLYSVEAGEGRRNGAALTSDQTRALLRALKLKPGGPPTFVLVGKDGGVKMVKGSDVDLDQCLQRSIACLCGSADGPLSRPGPTHRPTPLPPDAYPADVSMA